MNASEENWTRFRNALAKAKSKRVAPKKTGATAASTAAANSSQQSESAEECSALAKAMQFQGALEYEAYFSTAQVRCEQLANVAHERQPAALLNAARTFWEADRAESRFGVGSANEQNAALCAVELYANAARTYEEQSDCFSAVSAFVELGDRLVQAGRLGDAIRQYSNAATLCSSAFDAVDILRRVALAKLAIRDLDGALNTFTELDQLVAEEVGGGVTDAENVSNAYAAQIGSEAEIFRVLLLLLVQPNGAALRQEHSALLERFASSRSPHSFSSHDAFLAGHNPDVFVAMQSLVDAYQSSDVRRLVALEDALVEELTAEQNELLLELVEVAKRGSDLSRTLIDTMAVVADLHAAAAAAPSAP